MPESMSSLSGWKSLGYSVLAMRNPENPRAGAAVPAPDPLAALIRKLRARRGLSLQALGRLVEASAPHLYHIETGRKLPSEELAARIARALDQDPDVFRAWVRATGRSDWRTTHHATILLDNYIRDPEVARLMAEAGIDVQSVLSELRAEEPGGLSPHARPTATTREVTGIEAAARSVLGHEAAAREAASYEAGAREAAAREAAAYEAGAQAVVASRLEPSRHTLAAESRAAYRSVPGDAHSHARILVPVLDPGRDPAQRGWSIMLRRGAALRLDPGDLATVEHLDHPFAYALTPEIARRAAGALPSEGFAILTREAGWPPDPGHIYAVRHQERIELGPVMWNGGELLLLPPPGATDFVVLRTAADWQGSEVLRGRVVLIARPT